MVQLMKTDVATKEVLGWKGLHVFHYPMSSCSQKLRIFLNLKGLEWHSHTIDLANNATPCSVLPRNQSARIGANDRR